MPIINTVRTGSEGSPGLEYRLYTTPHPIRVSPDGAQEGDGPEVDPVRARLDFVASNNGRYALRLEKLSVEIPTGESAAQLALSLDRAEMDISLAGWTAAVVGERVEFTTTDPYAELAPGDGLTFKVSNIPVNHEVGAVELRVREEFDGDGGNTVSIVTGKFPQDFFLDDFAADAYEIDNGGSVVLTWKRSEGVTTTLLYGGNDPSDVTDLERTVVEKVTATTTFYLIGRVGDVEIMRSVLVTVLNPDLVVNTLTVNRELFVKNTAGDVNLLRVGEGNGFGVNAPASFHNTVTANDTVTVRGELTAQRKVDAKAGLDVAETLIAKGAATVQGQLSAEGDLAVDGNFNVREFLTVDPTDDAYGTAPGRFQVANAVIRPGDILVRDGIRVEGELAAEGGTTVSKHFTLDSMTGGVSLLGSSHNLNARHPFSGQAEGTMYKYRANTDGFVFATVKRGDRGCVARANIHNLSTNVVTGALADPANLAPDRTSAVMTVGKGQEFGLTRAVWSGHVYIYFRWFSMGPGAPEPSYIGTASVSADEFTEAAETDTDRALDEAGVPEPR